MNKIFRVLSLIWLINLLVGFSAGANGIDDISIDFLEEKGLISQRLFDSDIVTRNDCIVSIMKIIGVTESTASGLIGIPRYQPIFDDVHLWRPSDSYYINQGYIYAANIHNIAYGNENRYFLPFRPVTAQEALAFIVRCINNQWVDDEAASIGKEEIISIAKTKGILLATDRFYNNENIDITPSEFCILLSRLLNQPRYRYFNDKGECLFGKQNDKPYIDYLKEQ